MKARKYLYPYILLSCLISVVCYVSVWYQVNLPGSESLKKVFEWNIFFLITGSYLFVLLVAHVLVRFGMLKLCLVIVFLFLLPGSVLEIGTAVTKMNGEEGYVLLAAFLIRMLFIILGVLLVLGKIFLRKILS